MVMNWAYVARFFDGEGSVSPQGLRTTCLTIIVTQAGDTGKEVLEEMRDFMASEGIGSKLAPRVEHYPNRKPVYRLCTSGPRAALMLKKMFPYLRVKKVIAQDVIRFRKMYPSIWHSPMAKAYRTEHGIRVNAARKVA